MVRDRAIVTIADQYKVVYDLSIGAIVNDLERPLTHISRSRQYPTLNVAVTVEDRDIFTMEDKKELVSDLSNGAISNDLQ